MDPCNRATEAMISRAKRNLGDNVRRFIALARNYAVWLMVRRPPKMGEPTRLQRHTGQVPDFGDKNGTHKQIHKQTPRVSTLGSRQICAPLQRRCDALEHSHHVSESTLTPTPHPTQRYSTVHASLKRWSRKPSSTSRTWYPSPSRATQSEQPKRERERDGEQGRGPATNPTPSRFPPPPLPPLACGSFVHTSLLSRGLPLDPNS